MFISMGSSESSSAKESDTTLPGSHYRQLHCKMDPHIKGCLENIHKGQTAAARPPHALCRYHLLIWVYGLGMAEW